MPNYPYYYPTQYNAYPTQMNVAPTQQVQNNVLVRVQNENEARMYPVAPGASVIFTDENAPYIYTKSVNMSQLDRPIFDKYRLVKEDPAVVPTAQEKPEFDPEKYVTKEEFLTWATKLKDSLFKNGDESDGE